MILYRGFTDTKIPEEFKEKGGSEYAPMSTSSDPAGMSLSLSVRSQMRLVRSITHCVCVCVCVCV